MKRSPLVPREQLDRAAPLIRVAAHPIRLRILDFLRHGPACVGEIAEAAECGQAVTSQHLGVLRQHGVLAASRDGQRVYYRLVRIELLGLLDCIQNHCRVVDGEGEDR
ncbi:MAG: ArsR family transcriptional regulator [Planctomycetota bacterium]|nr:MAG: ArsR family transcriptional regulator [Planctomycetota bacterium]